jgi:hypothetical protein
MRISGISTGHCSGFERRWAVTWVGGMTRLSTADALSFVTTDLLKRLGFPTTLEEEWSGENDPSIQSLERTRERTVERLAGIAERLADAGDINRAFALDAQMDSFESDQPMTTYTPDLGEFRTREGVTVVFSKRPLDDARQEVGWLADQLRPDPIKVNEYGNPVPPGERDASRYRWGLLFKLNEDPATAWNQRFDSGSWLRRIFATASRELPVVFGLKVSDTN